MKDPKWHSILTALSPYLRESDIVLAPRGDWPTLPCKLRVHDELIELGDATILVLHKAYLPAIDKVCLKSVADEWQCLCGNEVFLCFARDARRTRDARFEEAELDFAPLKRFFDARGFRRRRSTLWYIHLPKAAGTSLWRSLQQRHPSHVYFTNPAMFAAHPPDPAEYDLIGGHLPLALIRQYVGPDDHVVGLMRQPTERMLSALLHCRRPSMDGSSLWGAMAAMRELSFAKFLEQASGRIEAQSQLHMLGHDYGALSVFQPELALERARDSLGQARYLFAPSEEAARFVGRNAGLFGIKPSSLGHLNQNDYAGMAEDVAEFGLSRARVEQMNQAERALYEFVSARFDA